MGRASVLVAINLIILMGVAMLLVPSLFVVHRLASVKSAGGKVEVARDGSSAWQPLGLDARLGRGDRVRTGSDGTLEMVWPGGTRWHLEANSQLEIERSVSEVNSDESSQLKLQKGTLGVRIVGNEAEIAVQTPTSVVRAQNAVFYVEADGDVQVARGRVERENKGRKTRVSPPTGQVVVNPLLQPLLEVTIVPSTGEAMPNQARLQGRAERGARLQINDETTNLRGNGRFSKRVQLVPGHNQWRVQAIDASNSRSSECVAAEFDIRSGVAHAVACRE